MINWHEGLTTGVPDLDDHHKEIFQKYNEFYAVISRGAAAREEEAGKILETAGDAIVKMDVQGKVLPLPTTGFFNPFISS